MKGFFSKTEKISFYLNQVYWYSNSGVIKFDSWNWNYLFSFLAKGPMVRP